MAIKADTRQMALRLLLCIGSLSLVYAGINDEDLFNEELFLKNLPDGRVYAHFQFTTTWNMSLDSKQSFQHFHMFPKSLGEVLHQFSVRELHLSMTQGLWRHEKWGYPFLDAPPGAELWVWFLENKQLDINSRWTDLIHVLSGMFCASINFMDMKSTITPKFSFRPQGVTTADFDRLHAQNVRYSTLARESVCTENLTPWKKLLPCGSKIGLASLLNAMRLFDASYHSIGVHFRPVCLDQGCGQMGVELSQTLSVVLDPVIAHTSTHPNKLDWSLKKLFGRMIASSCSLASISTIYLDIGTNATGMKLNPVPSRIDEIVRGETTVRYAVFKIADFVSSGHVLNLDVKHDEQREVGPIRPPLLTATQFQTGSGQAGGGVMCLLHNNHETAEMVVIYQIVLPWFIRTYLHTVNIEHFDSNTPGQQNVVVAKPLHVHFVPGKDRQRPYHMELVIRLPAHSVTRLSFQFERQLLRWVEYPPDANHGFYIGSAVVSAILPDARNYTGPAKNHFLISSIESDGNTIGSGYFVRIHTESLLVALPTPDFSMPYNVICLTCTVLAIVFGSIHNLTTRRFIVYDATKHRGIVVKLKERLLDIKGKILRKKPAPTEASIKEGGSPGYVPAGDIDVPVCDSTSRETT